MDERFRLSLAATNGYSLVTFDFIGTGSDTITLAGANNGRSFNIDDVSVNAIPPLDQNATAHPFAQVNIADPNASQTETVTVTPSNAANGTLFDPNAASDGSTIDPGTGIYTVSGSPAAVTAALDALLFRPTEHQAAPGSTVTTWLTIGGHRHRRRNNQRQHHKRGRDRTE